MGFSLATSGGAMTTGVTGDGDTVGGAGRWSSLFDFHMRSSPCRTFTPASQSRACPGTPTPRPAAQAFLLSHRKRMALGHYTQAAGWQQSAFSPPVDYFGRRPEAGVATAASAVGFLSITRPGL